MPFLRHLPWRTLTVMAVACAAAAIPQGVATLGLERDALLAGEWWRLLTGHLVHLGKYHLVWDVAALGVLGVLFERYLGGRTWAALLVSALVVGGGVLLLAPGMQLYCGLSGVLNGLFVMGCLSAWRHERDAGRRWLGGLFLMAVVADLAKIVVEAGAERAIFTDPAMLAGEPVPLAHALGALAGWIAYAWHRQWSPVIEVAGKEALP